MKRHTTKSRGRARSLACFLAVAVGAPLAVPGLASADPISDKRAQAQALADQISVLGNQEAALSEHYDAAVLAEQQAGTQVDAAAKQQAASRAAVTQASNALRSDAIDAYTHGGNMNGGISSMSNLADAQNSLLRVEYAKTLATSQNDHRDQYRLAEAQANAKKAQLSAAQQQAAAQASKADSARRAVAGSAAQLQATYKQTQGQLATLVAQAQAAQAAEQARQAQLADQARQQTAQRAAAAQAAGAQAATDRAHATPTAGSSGSGPASAQPQRASSTTGGQSSPASSAPAQSAPAPTGSGGSAAVAAAMSRLGDPYVWGAAGPNTFDCSGLTMWAWARAGVSLPHYSGSQYDSTTHISMSQLQPGDLVFFANPGDHMAMYIGGGQVIEAPYTGANVRIEPMYSQFVLASRPN